MQQLYMNGYPVSWNRIRTQRNIERIGQDLSASGGLIQKIYPVEFPEWNHIQPGSMRLILLFTLWNLICHYYPLQINIQE